MKKKFLALSLAAAMCFSLAGCAIDISLPGKSAKDAGEVVAGYMALMEESVNYHVDMDMDFEIAAKGDGVTIELPIGMGLSVDVMDGNMHGDMAMVIEFMNSMSMDEKAEIYVEQGRRSTTSYMYDEADGYWTVSEDGDTGVNAAADFSGMDADDFKDAKMEYDKKAGTYTITQSFADFAVTGDTYDILEDVYGGMAEMMEMDPDEFLDEWEKAEVVYVFDKDFYLQTVDVEGCEFSTTVKEDGMEMGVSVSLALSFEFSDYGQIEEGDVEVPQKVIDEAVSSVTMGLDDSDVNVDIDWGSGEDDPVPGGDIDDPGTSADDVPSHTEESRPATTPGKNTNVAVSDKLGSLNGVAITTQGDVFETTFGADGWEWDGEEGYSFVVCENSKYEDAELYLYNETRTDTTWDDISTYGSYGYSIDCSFSDSHPAMTWGGITFGATADDVISVYGQPDYTYSGDIFTTYEYDIDSDTEITFYVYPDRGVQHVEVAVYGW